MKVTQLRLANLRAIEAAEYRFPRGLNLIAGTYCVGNSGVLRTPPANQDPRARASVTDSPRGV